MIERLGIPARPAREPRRISPIEARQGYREQLVQIERSALGGLDLVAEALERAMRALLRRDVGLAGIVVADDDRIDALYVETHQTLLALLALQAPVAGDLRIVAALLHVIRSIERMGDQCVTIAKMALQDEVRQPADEPLMHRIGLMADLVAEEITQAKQAFAEREEALAEDLVRRDREVNALNREIFRRAVEIGDDQALREWAMRMALVARCIERIGDNTVDIGEQAAFVVTGRLREFSDASSVRVP